MKLQTLKDEYKFKLDDLDKAIEEEKRLRSLARKNGDPDTELAIRSADISGLQKVRQVYVQILHDLENL